MSESNAALFSHHRHRVQTGHGAIAYYDIGEGRPVLFLHGFPDTPEGFAGQIEAFKRAGYRCILPYMPGYGDSDLPPKGNATPLAIAELLDGFVREAIAPDRLIVIGHDWGSVAAQLLAGLYLQAKQPAYRVERLVLAAVPPVRTMLRNMNPRQVYRSRYMYYFQLPGAARRIRQRNLDDIRTLWSRWSPGLASDHPQLERVIGVLGRPGALENAIGYYRYMLNPAYLLSAGGLGRQFQLLFQTKALAALIICGEQDQCIGAEMYRGGADAFPHPLSREVVLGQAGHFLHIEKPKAFNDEVLSFLASPSEAGA